MLIVNLFLAYNLFVLAFIAAACLRSAQTELIGQDV
jgi:hypothetical protein